MEVTILEMTADGTLRERADRYRTVFDALDVAVCLIERLPLRADGRRDYRYVAMNPVMQSMFGIGDLTGQTIRDNFPDEIEDWYDDYDRVLASGGSVRFERESVPQGLVLEMSIARLEDFTGHCLLITIQDVTKRKRAEEAVRHSEERFRLLVTASSDIVYRMSADWTAMHTLDGKNVLADTSDSSVTWLDDYIPDSDKPFVQAAIAKAIRTRSPFELEHRVRRADGTVGWTFSRAIPLLDARGEIVEWFGAAGDITERKRAEADLSLLAAIGEDLVRQTDADGMIEQLGSRIAGHFHASVVAFAEVQGPQEHVTVVDEWTRADVPSWKGTRIDAFHTEELRQACRTGRATVVRDAAKELPGEAAQLAALSIGAFISVPLLRDGKCCCQLTLADTSARDWRDSEVDLFREVSTRIWARLENLRAEAVVRSSGEQLKEADRRKDEFLAMLAHELRNPLAPIRTGLELIRVAGNTPAAVERVRSLMDRQVAHMVRLIDDLLDVSRITSGKIQLQRQPTPLNGLINSAIEANRAAIAAKQIDLRVELPASPCVLNVDPTRLVQVISNLLHNATKFTRSGGTILVRGRIGHSAPGGAGELSLSVSDSGIGIPPEFLPHVFDLFAQGPAGGSQPGLGIGLALARTLIEMHDGTIAVHSDGTDRGSEFVIRLPISVEVPEGAPGESLDGRAVNCRVLVIDDNRDAAVTLTMLIEELGGECRAAYDGDSGIREALDYRPDVVLLDIGMPGLDGYETCERIRRALGEHVILVALTGFGQQQDKDRANRAGFDAHLTKPANPATLQRLLSQCSPGQTQGFSRDMLRADQ